MVLRDTTLLAEGCASLACSRKERTLPDPARVIAALRQIGYSLEHAIADLVDNSISARASTVLVRFVCAEERIRSIAVADNGSGMSESQLSEAMRFGSERDLRPDSLGRYGMGLKLASLGFARCLTVATVRGRSAGARRWTIRGVEEGWDCDVLSTGDARGQVEASWGPLDLKSSGTVVVWDDLDKLVPSAAGMRATVRSLARRLETHLGLCFHRFLECGRLAIFLDQQSEGLPEQPTRLKVPPLNPFAYPAPGRSDYPKTFRACIEGIGNLELEAHIWPPNSELPQYRLGNRAAARQGFYFYRNGRLIQAGGWNGLLQHESEPHGSLARVRIDLPPTLDSSFGLNVQKSAVVVPPGFEAAVGQARARDGSSFEAFRSAAHQLYRHQDRSAVNSHPLVPGHGLPTALTGTALKLLLPEGGKARAVRFEWRVLPADQLFALDRGRCVICLNSVHRKVLLDGRRGSVTDLPLVKTMLFLLAADHLHAERISRRQARHLVVVNELLTAAVLSASRSHRRRAGPRVR